MFCRLLFVLLSFFFLAIVFSVLLRFMDSNYPIGIFKLILQRCTVYMKSYARACASTVDVLQRVELLSLKLIKQGYVAPRVKYLKYCILFQRNLPFVFTGSFGRGAELVSFSSQYAFSNNKGNFPKNRFLFPRIVDLFKTSRQVYVNYFYAFKLQIKCLGIKEKIITDILWFE